jgi:hypothetical protein
MNQPTSPVSAEEHQAALALLEGMRRAGALPHGYDFTPACSCQPRAGLSWLTKQMALAGESSVFRAHSCAESVRATEAASGGQSLPSSQSFSGLAG